MILGRTIETLLEVISTAGYNLGSFLSSSIKHWLRFKTSANAISSTSKVTTSEHFDSLLKHLAGLECHCAGESPVT